MKTNKGFTLIEILVVVAIISLLTSVVLAALVEAREKAKGSKFRQEVQQFITAIELYRTQNNDLLPLKYYTNGNNVFRIYTINSNGIESAYPSDNNVTDSLLSDSGLLSKIPVPNFTNGLITLTTHRDYYCKNKERYPKYVIYIGGDATTYFDDWPTLMNGYTNSEISLYKCFSLE